MDLGPETRAPEGVTAQFDLRYHDMLVGNLRAEDGWWNFSYSDEFRQSDSLRPLIEFPDVAKTYRSRRLWPFFLMRIPSMKQAAIQDVVEHEAIDVDDEIQLLKRFGKRTVSNPFELVESRS
jgi:HipA-like protein